MSGRQWSVRRRSAARSYWGLILCKKEIGGNHTSSARCTEAWPDLPIHGTLPNHAGQAKVGCSRVPKSCGAPQGRPLPANQPRLHRAGAHPRVRRSHAGLRGLCRMPDARADPCFFPEHVLCLHAGCELPRMVHFKLLPPFTLFAVCRQVPHPGGLQGTCAPGRPPRVCRRRGRGGGQPGVGQGG